MSGLQRRMDWIHSATDEELLDQFRTNCILDESEYLLLADMADLTREEALLLRAETKAEILRRMKG